MENPAAATVKNKLKRPKGAGSKTKHVKNKQEISYEEDDDMNTKIHRPQDLDRQNRTLHTPPPPTTTTLPRSSTPTDDILFHDLFHREYDDISQQPDPQSAKSRVYYPTTSTLGQSTAGDQQSKVSESDSILTNLTFQLPVQRDVNCLHTNIGMQIVPHIIESQRKHAQIVSHIEKNYSERTCNNKVVQKGFCVKLRSTTKSQNDKMFNVNMVLAASNKNEIKQVWFNSPAIQIIPFVLTPKTALCVMEHISNKLKTTESMVVKDIVGIYEEGQLAIQICPEEGIKIIKTQNQNMSIYSINKICNVTMFLEELECIIQLLTYHINLARIREDFLLFANSEFARCECSFTNEIAIKICLTYYYTQLGQKYSPLIPHYVSVTDLIHNLFVY